MQILHLPRPSLSSRRRLRHGHPRFGSSFVDEYARRDEAPALELISACPHPQRKAARLLSAKEGRRGCAAEFCVPLNAHLKWVIATAYNLEDVQRLANAIAVHAAVRH
jgi:hypothetical protein